MYLVAETTPAVAVGIRYNSALLTAHARSEMQTREVGCCGCRWKCRVCCNNECHTDDACVRYAETCDELGFLTWQRAMFDANHTAHCGSNEFRGDVSAYGRQQRFSCNNKQPTRRNLWTVSDGHSGHGILMRSILKPDNTCAKNSLMIFAFQKRIQRGSA
jgi:hypothetical protein